MWAHVRWEHHYFNSLKDQMVGLAGGKRYGLLASLSMDSPELILEWIWTYQVGLVFIRLGPTCHSIVPA